MLILRHVEELDVAAIAKVLDLGESAAKMRLKRARDRFWEEHAALTKTPDPPGAASDPTAGA